MEMFCHQGYKSLNILVGYSSWNLDTMRVLSLHVGRGLFLLEENFHPLFYNGKLLQWNICLLYFGLMSNEDLFPLLDQVILLEWKITSLI
jgi:hypothetical protein